MSMQISAAVTTPQHRSKISMMSMVTSPGPRVSGRGLGPSGPRWLLWRDYSTVLRRGCFGGSRHRGGVESFVGKLDAPEISHGIENFDAHLEQTFLIFHGLRRGAWIFRADHAEGANLVRNLVENVDARAHFGRNRRAEQCSITAHGNCLGLRLRFFVWCAGEKF